MAVTLLIGLFGTLLSALIGYFLKDLLWSGRDISKSELDFGRKFASYAAFFSTIAASHFFYRKEFDEAIVSSLITIIMYVVIAFVVGVIYGLFASKGNKASEFKDSKNENSNEFSLKVKAPESNSHSINGSAMNVQINLDLSINEDEFWEKALIEYESEERVKGVWARLFTQFNGDENLIKVAYIKERANRLISDRKQFLLKSQEDEEVKRNEQRVKQAELDRLVNEELDLMVAVKSGNFSTAATLLSRGVSPQIAENGKTLLEFAIENGDSQMVVMIENYLRRMKIN